MIAGYKAVSYDLGQDLTMRTFPSLTSIDPSQVVAHDSLTYELHAFNDAFAPDQVRRRLHHDHQGHQLATDRQAIANGLWPARHRLPHFISPLTWYYNK